MRTAIVLVALLGLLATVCEAGQDCQVIRDFKGDVKRIVCR